MHSLAFDLVGNPTVQFVGLPSPFVANGVQTAGSIGASTFGNFDYAVDFPHAAHPPAITTFSFEVKKNVSTDPALVLDFNLVNGKQIFFTTDINGTNGNTGNVGATLTGGVPEPATWAMMLVGFGGMGALLRQRRRMRATLA
jgi:hypothetical protein